MILLNKFMFVDLQKINTLHVYTKARIGYKNNKLWVDGLGMWKTYAKNVIDIKIVNPRRDDYPRIDKRIHIVIYTNMPLNRSILKLHDPVNVIFSYQHSL